MLNDLEIAGFVIDVERQQTRRFEARYRNVIELVRSAYESLNVPQARSS